MHTYLKRAFTAGFLSASLAACSKSDSTYNNQPQSPGSTGASVLAAGEKDISAGGSKEAAAGNGYPAGW